MEDGALLERSARSGGRSADRRDQTQAGPGNAAAAWGGEMEEHRVHMGPGVLSVVVPVR
jgi:hypothetical protein